MRIICFMCIFYHNKGKKCITSCSKIIQYNSSSNTFQAITKPTPALVCLTLDANSYKNLEIASALPFPSSTLKFKQGGGIMYLECNVYSASRAHERFVLHL